MRLNFVEHLQHTWTTSGLVGARNTIALGLPLAWADAAAAAVRCCSWITRAAMCVLPEPAGAHRNRRYVQKLKNAVIFKAAHALWRCRAARQVL
jgi:hypothetical protein